MIAKSLSFKNYVELTGIMSEYIDTILLKLLDWGVPFLLGLLFRRRIGRFLVILKKKLFNDVLSISLLSVRSYHPTELAECGSQLYDDLRTKIPSTKLLDRFPNGIRISVPIFGNIRALMERISDEEENETNMEAEATGKIKVTISPESPTRLGVREVHHISIFAQYSDLIFGDIERTCLKESKIIPESSYTLIEVPRFGPFREEKTFDIEDEELGATVHATVEKLNIIVTASIQVGKAAEKYFLS